MKLADQRIIRRLNEIYDAQAAGGAASFASLTGSPSDNAALDSALDAKAPVPDDTAYGAGWDGSTLAPTQGKLYDKIEAVVASIPSGAVSVLVSVSVDLNTDDTPQTIYTVPVGKVLIITDVILMQFSVTPSAGQFSIKANGTEAISRTVDVVDNPVSEAQMISFVGATAGGPIQGGLASPRYVPVANDIIQFVLIVPEGHAATAVCKIIGTLL